MRQGKIKTQDIVVMIQKQGLKVDQVAKLLGMSRQAIWKRMRKAGVTSRSFVWIEFICAFCGTTNKRRRRQAQRSEDNYCNQECYFADLESPGYAQWRQGSRIARAIVAQYVNPIPVGAIVHHKDGNDRNNDRSNLMLLASQADHIAIHRSRKSVNILWDGANL